MNPSSMEQLVIEVDRIVRFAVFKTAHPCLYFNHARCRVLRQWAYRVQLKLGLYNQYGKSNTAGHCWISLNRQAFFEEKDPHEMNPDKIGKCEDTVYRARLNRDQERTFIRLKKNKVR